MCYNAEYSEGMYYNNWVMTMGNISQLDKELFNPERSLMRA